MNISEITGDDRQQVIELWDRCDGSPATSDAHDLVAEAGKHSSSSILIGKKDGDVIAGVIVGFDGQRGWIYGVCVDKTFQRQGFGKAIVSAAETWLRERGAPSIHLQLRFTNLAAIGFYDKLGYRFQDMVVLGKHFETTRHPSSVGAHLINMIEKEDEPVWANLI